MTRPNPACGASSFFNHQHPVDSLRQYQLRTQMCIYKLHSLAWQSVCKNDDPNAHSTTFYYSTAKLCMCLLPLRPEKLVLVSHTFVVTMPKILPHVNAKTFHIHNRIKHMRRRRNKKLNSHTHTRLHSHFYPPFLHR